MSSTPDVTTMFGVQQTLSSIYQMSPSVLEQLAQWIEQRGLRTPVSQVVGYKADLAVTRVSQTIGSQTIPSGTQTDLTFATEEIDSTNLFDTGVSNTKIIARVDGIYAISAGCDWSGDANTAGTLRTLALLVNGVPRAATDAPPIAGVRQAVHTIFRLKVGDNLRAAVYQDSGGTRSLAGGSLTFLAATLLNRYV